MQAAPRVVGPPAPVKIYNAVYSSVYECMVRGIAVMRRRADSYVNATQILKVAGVDKGRRTKILEKEILPGKHEIVQGGYGKYQGTWIPLDRGRDIAVQYGVAHLLAPLFDFMPSSAAMGSLPGTLPHPGGTGSPAPLSASSSFSSLGNAGGFLPTSLPSAPIMPGSALRLLNQGRAQGLFTPSSSSLHQSHLATYPSPGGMHPQSPALRPGLNGEDGPSPAKRARTEPPHLEQIQTIQRTGTQPQIPVSVQSQSQRASILTAICQQDDPNTVLDLLREIPLDNHVGVDVVLDDLGHTALHVAASLGRLRTVAALIDSGADIHRGNYNGETPLIRACLALENFNQQSFASLVETLQSSIHTLDTSRKSVLHHVMALAGVKNRAVVARYYLDQIFVCIVNKLDGDFRSIVDLQDEHGDTALNIAARVGNRSLVRTLLDVGANRILPNKLGLRPGDFGVENEELGGPRVEDLISSLRSGPSVPVQKSQDVIADMTAMIQTLSTEFSAEVKSKQDALDVTQAHLRAATRQLSEQRKLIQVWQVRCGELDQINQRIRNVQQALADEDRFDWTGRTDLNGNDAKQSAGPAFQWRGQNSTMAGLGGLVDVSFNLDVEPTIPLSDSMASLIRLRRLKMWHVRMEKLMEERLKSLHGASAEREFQCKKIVALCTNVPVDKVEEMLDDLVIAVESETQFVDIGRVSGFMQKVRDGVI
ncbi:hypothetical protein HETIRDRAFT_478021 [Heterobasidion irregulare TC 32-1]|uniref:HTH APSES-type domain-containing protein n=1 Tax=Heterobasidion irregulare (strain TC 32-1) TaxID=747525 RepID=W4JYW4_HETIT|nr:uncharacterized protein HETIRDRAFT_478021 [Heterobasidion irregulare TC 32-1]ETW78743.1 hypothetical protein HETIRDRAFT_478021 [Heterobasidion irregulare TC 32-1]